jgi:hypothetical protein
MTNYRSDKDTDLEIAVDKISIMSKNYRIKPLVAADSAQNLKRTISGHAISWQEQAVMHFVISPLESITSYCTTTHCHLGEESDGEQYESSSTVNNNSLSGFICLENAHDRFTASLEEHKKELAMIEAELEKKNEGPRSIAEIRRARGNLSTSSSDRQKGESKLDNNKDEPKCHPSSRALLCSPHHNSSSEINVICSWKTKGNSPGEIIEGQHHLRQLVVRPQHKSKSCPLLIGANYKSAVQHDFSTSPLNLDMEISIRNRLFHSNVNFEFSLKNNPEIDFIGPERFEHVLKAGDEVVFPLKAVLFESGMHNLQCVKLTVNNSDGSKTPYSFPLQWIVQVNN